MSEAYEEMNDARLIRHLRAARHEDGHLNWPVIAEALARILEPKPKMWSGILRSKEEQDNGY